MKIEKLENKVIFNKVVDKQDWQSEILKERKIAAKKIKLTGFRPGKVPEDVALKSIPAESVLIEAANRVINNTIKSLDSLPEFKNIDAEVHPTPTVEIGQIFSVNELSFSVVYWMLPKVTIDNYKKLDVNLTIPTVDEKEVDQEIDHILSKERMLSDKADGIIASGDLVNFDFHGFINDVEFAGGKAEKYDLEIGSNQFIPGFEDQMIGLKKGETKEISVTFPKDYHAPDMVGKPAVFKIKIHDVKSISKPQLDEALIKQLKLPDEKVKTPEQFKKFLKENILNYKKQQSYEQNIQQINAAIYKNAKYSEIPNVILEDEKKEVEKQFMHKLKELNMDKNTFLKISGSDDNSFNSQIEESAKSSIVVFSAIDYIGEKEKILVDEKNINERYALLAKGHNSTIEEIKKYVDHEAIENALLKEKVLLKLIEWNSKVQK